METMNDIRRDLESLKRVVNELKKNMVDMDMILTPEEEKSLEESMEEYKTGKAIPLDEFQKEINK